MHHRGLIVARTMRTYKKTYFHPITNDDHNILKVKGKVTIFNLTCQIGPHLKSLCEKDFKKGKERGC